MVDRQSISSQGSESFMNKRTKEKKAEKARVQQRHAMACNKADCKHHHVRLNTVALLRRYPFCDAIGISDVSVMTNQRSGHYRFLKSRCFIRTDFVVIIVTNISNY